MLQFPEMEHRPEQDDDNDLHNGSDVEEVIYADDVSSSFLPMDYWLLNIDLKKHIGGGVIRGDFRNTHNDKYEGGI